jgi:Ca2+-transporting ATPase
LPKPRATTDSMEPIHFHTLTPEQAFEALSSGPQGLSEAAVRERLEHYGPNELAQVKKITAGRILLRQFANLLIVILLAATGISFFLGEHLDAWVILAIVLACVVLGFIQEYRAEKAAAALQKLAAPVATVVRAGKEREIPAREVACWRRST